MGMTERDKRLMLAVVGLVILGGCWLLMIGPKLSAANSASQQRDDAAKALADAKAAATGGEQQKKEFRVSYAQLVRLGKAVPSANDDISLVVQMHDLANASGIEMVKLGIVEGASAASLPGGAAATPQPTTCDSGASGASGSTGASGATGATAASGVGQTVQDARSGADRGSADANRAGASDAGATVSCATAPTATDLAAAGAGLELDSFDLTFEGSFFDLHRYLSKMYDLVDNRNGRIRSKGRLLQISKVDLKVKGFPKLEAVISVTGYRLPSEVSPTAGATPSGPAPATTPTADGAPSPPPAVTGVR